MTSKFQTTKDVFGIILILGPPLIQPSILIIVMTGIVDMPLELVIIGTIFFWTFFFIVWNFTYY